MLRWLSTHISRLSDTGGLRIAALVLLALVIHLLEIFLFAGGFYLFDVLEGYGDLIGDTTAGYQDFFYYSAVTYTTLGFGDITPEGPLRVLTAIESLMGLLLSAWTASVIFLAMQRYWNVGSKED
jgi:hypothetical protein